MTHPSPFALGRRLRGWDGSCPHSGVWVVVGVTVGGACVKETGRTSPWGWEGQCAPPTPWGEKEGAYVI